MNNDKTYVGRKRSVFIEKITLVPKMPTGSMLSHFGLPLFFNMEYLRKNRFFVEMQIDNKILSSDNIQGFKIYHFDEGEKTIKINTALHIKDWITDYNKVNIIKIYLLDGFGKEVRGFDFDVVFKGYTFDCDYKEDTLATPVFSYKILE